jgi:hypothetical protein
MRETNRMRLEIARLRDVAACAQQVLAAREEHSCQDMGFSQLELDAEANLTSAVAAWKRTTSPSPAPRPIPAKPDAEG